jgi:hypothetical protein
LYCARNSGSRFGQVRPWQRKPRIARVGIRDHGSKRLADFMRNHRSETADHRDPSDACQIGARQHKCVLDAFLFFHLSGERLIGSSKFSCAFVHPSIKLRMSKPQRILDASP